MFISDTHFGSNTLESSRLVYAAYKIALDQDIETVVHVGDLIQACCLQYDKKYEVVLKELETALYWMPDNITTKLLLGNHDYSAIRTYPEIIPYFFTNPKLDILGMHKVILNWDGLVDIRLHHTINQLKYPDFREYQGSIMLEGHHHDYSFMEQERTIYLPTLSKMGLEGLSKLSNESSKYCYPLFLIASKQGESNLLFEVFGVDEFSLSIIQLLEEIELNTQTQKLTLQKKLDFRSSVNKYSYSL